MKVKVVNFQSVRKAEIEVEGLTIVTGRSNLGKSAVIRALHAAYFGREGTDFITRGQEHAGVAIQDPATDSLAWRKTRKPNPKKPSALQVGKQVHTKLGRGQAHADATAKLGVRSIRTATGEFAPQFAGQHDAPFLLFGSGSTTAELLKLISRADVVTTAQKAASRDRRDQEAVRKIRRADQAEATQHLASYDHVPGLRAQIEETKARVRQLEEQAQRAADAAERVDTLLTLNPVPVPTEKGSEVRILSARGTAELLQLIDRYPSLQPITLPRTPTLPTLLLTELQELIDGIDQVSTLTDELDVGLTAQRVHLDDQIEATAEELQQLLQQLGQCPTCGAVAAR